MIISFVILSRGHKFHVIAFIIIVIEAMMVI